MNWDLRLKWFRNFFNERLITIFRLVVGVVCVVVGCVLCGGCVVCGGGCGGGVVCCVLVGVLFVVVVVVVGVVCVVVGGWCWLVLYVV